MINLWRATSVLIGLGAWGITHANAVFEIIPQSTSVTVSGSASQNYVLTWTVKNNTSITTPIAFSGWGTPNSGSDLFTLTSTTCTTPVSPGGTCTMTMGIRGDAMTSNSLTVSPRFCLPNGQVCSTATLANRLSVTRTSTPVPQGSWKVHSVFDGASFPEFVSIYYPKLVVGFINSNYMPLVAECPDLTSQYNCTLLADGILSYDFESINNLSYAPNGSLYGIFTRSQVDAINPVRSYVMDIPASSSTWAQFTDPFNGTALGLDTYSDLGILFSSGFFHPVPNYGYPGIGSAKLYNTNSVQVNSQANTAASSLSGIVEDGLGHVFVSGPVSTYTITPTPDTTYLIWQWDTTSSDPTTAYTPINMPTNLSYISSMVSDGKGTIYIAGSDAFTDGHVWKYTAASGEFVDTGLVAESVITLYYSPYGYLLAGGIDNQQYNGAVWYYSGGEWTNMNLTNSSTAVSIAADANNDIIATGLDLDQNPTIWLFSSN